ncbi:MAG: hypothetical protein A3C90_02960 [Candidatus Magasanikbacteria bacterium RIFCSPHIGHO2_02_FULL_51_14]|uniref:EamA domain-containing protein n=1 Tax=Candidatus Magasanikbacteria bacterium RIFCSPHIGHO2_02_FULL_51_14 TaxID=1798683 RepID=A0A1F6MPX5_9BACT|nr:MAG: hypothetical protein A3C90_02960 [Candidatus Magasanikbacteria bacterium RIFCSPHIGHO2_02_FULL_51_14]
MLPQYLALENINFTSIAIASAFFAAIANILARTLLKNLRSQDFLGINFLTMGATLLLLSPIFYHFDASMLSISLIILIALIDSVANFFYFKTFEKTEASIATPILSLAPAFTFLLGWLFLGDVVGIKTFLLATIIIILILVISTDFQNFRTFRSSTLLPALTASFLFGVSAIPAKYLLDTLHVINAPTLYMFRAGFIALFALLFFGFSIQHITTKQYRVIFVRGIFVIVQWLLLYYALTRGSAGVAVTLGNITPVFVFFLSMLFLREKPTLKKLLASIFILIFSLII